MPRATGRPQVGDFQRIFQFLALSYPSQESPTLATPLRAGRAKASAGCVYLRKATPPHVSRPLRFRGSVSKDPRETQKPLGMKLETSRKRRVIVWASVQVEVAYVFPVSGVIGPGPGFTHVFVQSLASVTNPGTAPDRPRSAPPPMPGPLVLPLSRDLY